MRVFQDLCISADMGSMAAAADEMERKLPDGWTRDRETEERIQSDDMGSRPAFCFTCTKNGKRQAALLLLTQKDAGTFHVSNIIPASVHRLSHEEYNFVLQDFCDEVFRPYAENSGLSGNLTEPEARLDNWMLPTTAEKLRRFSSHANKSTGTSYPNDRKLWNDFVLASHREGNTFDSSTLQRWLVEEEGWPPEIAAHMAIEYEYGRDLLDFAENPRQSA